MTEKPEGNQSGLSRRELLKQVGIAGAAAAIPVRIFASAPAGTLIGALQASSRASTPDVLETLSSAEWGTLEAIVGRLIPTDESGPGAVEAHASRYIDRALGGALASARDAYRTGLAAVDRYAQASRGASFQALSPEHQDAVLRDMENDVATGFESTASLFFNLVRAHAIQGTFGDPFYGGNANFVGWDAIGYPGVRLAVTADEQRLDARVPPTHRSAYDHSMFSTKKPARARLEEGAFPHGD